MGRVMPLNVKKVRQNLHLSQPQFSERFGFPLSTLRNWEQGRRSPPRATRLLLMVISQVPEVVARAVEAERAGA
jgi:putative transcriptional regulator